jgi:hypothetical protein
MVNSRTDMTNGQLVSFFSQSIKIIFASFPERDQEPLFKKKTAERVKKKGQMQPENAQNDEVK